MSSFQINLSRRQLFTRSKNADKPNLPWVKNDLFIDLCTQCGKCQQACPEDIIKPSDGGFPRVDFSAGECTFCYQCAEVCPEPLFIPKEEAPWQVRASINDDCLAKRHVDCRSCGDSCEPQAIRFQLTLGSVAQPHVIQDSCTGCGACVSVCPTDAVVIKHN